MTRHHLRGFAQRALLAFALAALTPSARAQSATSTLQVNPESGETQEQFAARTHWWREARFGMFIHWGLYAVPADSTQGLGEWYFHNHTDRDPVTGHERHLQVKDYEKFAAQFNPVRFDAKLWVRTAKEAGMKYIVITSKHHDGFCMFNSKLTDYCITKATPFKRDPMKELAAECKRQGLKLCFYHSIMDWHHPDYLPRRAWEGDNRPADGANLDRYIEHMKGQLRELLTNYGPIGGIWFDGGWEHKAQEIHALDVVKMIRSIQPGIMINDRIDLPEDYSTPEQTIPANAMPGGRLWETCMTLNDTWGYARNDHNFKPADDLIHKLCDIASKGGNFLLNVGPTDQGEFTPETIDRLKRVGQWMLVNHECIYGTTASPFRTLSFDGRCTRKGDTLFLEVFHWPSGGLKLSGLKTVVSRAAALDGNEALAVTQSPDGPTIAAPARLDPIATVVKVELAGAPIVEDLENVLHPDAAGALVFAAKTAEIHGSALRYEGGPDQDDLGFWENAADYPSWEFEVPKDGAYSVEVVTSCPTGAEGSRYTVRVQGGSALTDIVQATGTWTTYRTTSLGMMTVRAGRHTLSVRALDIPHGNAMNLRKVILRP